MPNGVQWGRCQPWCRLPSSHGRLEERGWRTEDGRDLTTHSCLLNVSLAFEQENCSMHQRACQFELSVQQLHGLFVERNREGQILEDEEDWFDVG